MFPFSTLDTLLLSIDLQFPICSLGPPCCSGYLSCVIAALQIPAPDISISKPSPPGGKNSTPILLHIILTIIGPPESSSCLPSPSPCPWPAELDVQKFCPEAAAISPRSQRTLSLPLAFLHPSSHPLWMEFFWLG